MTFRKMLPLLTGASLSAIATPTLAQTAAEQSTDTATERTSGVG